MLRGVLQGLTNKKIGVRLGIPESSVKAAVQQLFQKTGVRTRGQLVRIALEERRGRWKQNPKPQLLSPGPAQVRSARQAEGAVERATSTPSDRRMKGRIIEKVTEELT